MEESKITKSHPKMLQIKPLMIDVSIHFLRCIATTPRPFGAQIKVLFTALVVLLPHNSHMLGLDKRVNFHQDHLSENEQDAN